LRTRPKKPFGAFAQTRACSASLRVRLFLRGRGRIAFVGSSPMRDEITPRADVAFRAIREEVIQTWRKKIGPRRITVGDREVSDTVEAQTALILVNATRYAFKPGPAITTAPGFAMAPRRRLHCSGPVRSKRPRPTSSGIPTAFTKTEWCRDPQLEWFRQPRYGSDIEFDAQGEFVSIAPTFIATPAIAAS